jgi:hypothetical protein
MRRLVGAKADGWITGGVRLRNLNVELASGNRAIDEAATEAGRDPRQVRRLLDFSGAFGSAGRGFLQGPPEQWVDELLPLAMDYGMSVFILVGDDPSAIERFGRDVAPALRERSPASVEPPTPPYRRIPKASPGLSTQPASRPEKWKRGLRSVFSPAKELRCDMSLPRFAGVEQFVVAALVSGDPSATARHGGPGLHLWACTNPLCDRVTESRVVPGIGRLYGSPPRPGAAALECLS